MSTDPTEPQGGTDRRRSREISLERRRPPLDVPGYEPERLLGMGAYGEVWVAVEQNTGRRVAIKFYAHRGGLDWSLLAREVEKLAFLFSDRYVVQLLNVGWNADPPYYIMEYLERGSLAERLEAGPMPVGEAVELFRNVAVGLAHAHDKGVLHCDLKPANILLDQDAKPRLADFGQSRLSHEQTPALGTLFYMAPEQADLAAVPEARWDVYALGAVLYCMLTGGPPYRTDRFAEQLEAAADLKQRLKLYRRLIHDAPPVAAHRRVRGVDRSLAEIIERCLAADPRERWPNVQAVLGALDAREARKARRPMMLLGAIGPALLLLVVAWFAWQGFSTAVRQSDKALTGRAFKTNEFAAQNVARAAGYELADRYRVAEELAESDALRQVLAEKTGADTPLGELLAQLSEPVSEPGASSPTLERLRREFRESSADRSVVQGVFARLIARHPMPNVVGWFLNDARGVQIARVPERPTIGKNFGWRTYFHGQAADRPESWRPGPGVHITRTHLSAVFTSQAINRWVVTVSAPIFDERPEGKTFLGVVALIVEVGRFVDFQRGDQQFAVLVDWRDGAGDGNDDKGLILQHPLFDKMLVDQDRVPDRFKDFRITADNFDRGEDSVEFPKPKFPKPPCRLVNYRDPLLPEGNENGEGRWLAQMEPVLVRGQDTGLAVIVQESHSSAIGSTLSRLNSSLVHYRLTALAVIAVVMIGLWVLALRPWSEPTPPPPADSANET
jgi:hypothetical protein